VKILALKKGVTMKNAIKMIVLWVMIVAVSVMLVACGGSGYDFADDVIHVRLENEASIQIVRDSIVIGPAFFSGLEIERIGFSYHTLNLKETVRRQLNEEYVENPINISSFRIAFFVYLSKPNHSTVLEYVEILNACADIYNASVVLPGPTTQ